MARWSSKLTKIIKMAGERKDEHFMESFLIKRNYEPKTKQEKLEFEEFSLVTSSMALLIHIAKADKIMHPEERLRIINDLTFQLEQRPFEYDDLAEKFGNYDKEIISNMYNKLLYDYEKGKLDLDEIIKILNMVYQNNPDKRLYLIRLCYYCALSDSYFDESEKKKIKEIAAKLKVSIKEMKRIESEVKKEFIQ